MPAGAPLLVSVSGGSDSVALLRVLLALHPRWRWRLHAVHFNHGFRKESDAEEAFVRALPSEHDVPLHVRRLPPSWAAVETEPRSGAIGAHGDRGDDDDGNNGVHAGDRGDRGNEGAPVDLPAEDYVRPLGRPPGNKVPRRGPRAPREVRDLETYRMRPVPMWRAL